MRDDRSGKTGFKSFLPWLGLLLFAGAIVVVAVIVFRGTNTANSPVLISLDSQGSPRVRCCSLGQHKCPGRRLPDHGVTRHAGGCRDAQSHYECRSSQQPVRNHECIGTCRTAYQQQTAQPIRVVRPGSGEHRDVSGQASVALRALGSWHADQRIAHLDQKPPRDDLPDAERFRFPKTSGSRCKTALLLCFSPSQTFHSRIAGITNAGLSLL